MTTPPSDWLTNPYVFRAAQPALARAVFAAVADTLAEDERAKYERVLDAALAGEGGDYEWAMGLLRHQFQDEPRVERIHTRVDRLWHLILDEIRMLLACSHSIISPDAEWLAAVPCAGPHGRTAVRAE